MLAYVFWHVPRAEAATPEYESLHREFREALESSEIRGYRGASAFRLSSIPWLGGSAGYEDWYLLDDSAGLDVLDNAAITGARQRPHDRVAAQAAVGTAGLYGLRRGSRIAPRVAYWLSKPDGMSYAGFESSLAALIADGCCLWGRRMTLGPAPEFCLHAPAPRELPHPALAIDLDAR
ncbi:MAG: hypothetical protein ACREST_01845 [Steroidobacteraceae bacterium]